MNRIVLFLMVLTISLLLVAKSYAAGCLTRNIYNEARNQPILGQIAVAWVTKNRRDDPRFPNDLCEVVYHKKNGAEVYQFSWLNDKDPKHAFKEEYAKDVAKSIAIAVWEGYIPDPTFGATHYHTTDVHPSWADDPRMIFLTQIGDHLFYRWMTRKEYSENKELFRSNEMFNN